MDLLNTELLKKCLEIYDDDVAESILDRYVNRSRIMKQVDNNLGLGDDLRKWIKVDIPESENTTYKDLINIIGNGSISYDNWKSGKADNGMKIGKYLLKNFADKKTKIEKLLTKRCCNTWL